MSLWSRIALAAVLAAAPGVASADGLYVSLKAEDSRASAGQPVTLRLTAVATHPFTLPAVPEFLVDDGAGFRARPEFEAKPVEASGDVRVTPEKSFKAAFTLAPTQPGTYKVRARYRVANRVFESNKVTLVVE